VSADTARLHGKIHSKTKQCHIFEGHLSAEEVAAREKELERAQNKRKREKQRQKKEQATGEARTVRENGMG
jgi:hypothetical protein